MGLGERLKQIRDAAGLNLREFAARVGTSAGRVSEIESNKSVPGGDLLMRLHAEFGVDLTWLLTGATAAGEIPEPLKPDEAALLDNYRHSPKDQQDILKATSAAFAKPAAPLKKAG